MSELTNEYLEQRLAYIDSLFNGKNRNNIGATHWDGLAVQRQLIYALLVERSALVAETAKVKQQQREIMELRTEIERSRA